MKLLETPLPARQWGFSIKEPNIPIVKIDNKEYEFDKLSAEAKGQLQSLQFVDAELQRLQAQAAVLQTARVSYFKALQQALAESPVPFVGDTIKLG